MRIAGIVSSAKLDGIDVQRLELLENIRQGQLGQQGSETADSHVGLSFAKKQNITAAGKRSALCGQALTRDAGQPKLKAKPSLGAQSIMTVTVKDNEALVVPPSVRRRAGLKGGQELEFKVSGGVITIRPKPSVADDEYTPEQRRVIDAQLAEGLADVAAGRVRGPFSTHKEFIASLHKEARKLSRKKTTRPAR
jgi:AbrB family looped-hinge helix DNA binding protein